MAALGSLWRPLRTLTPAQLATHRDALIHTAMAGCAPTNTRPDPPHQRTSPARPSAQRGRSEPASDNHNVTVAGIRRDDINHDELLIRAVARVDVRDWSVTTSIGSLDLGGLVRRRR